MLIQEDHLLFSWGCYAYQYRDFCLKPRQLYIKVGYTTRYFYHRLAASKDRYEFDELLFFLTTDKNNIVISGQTRWVRKTPAENKLRELEKEMIGICNKSAIPVSNTKERFVYNAYCVSKLYEWAYGTGFTVSTPHKPHDFGLRCKLSIR